MIPTHRIARSKRQYGKSKNTCASTALHGRCASRLCNGEDSVSRSLSVTGVSRVDPSPGSMWIVDCERSPARSLEWRTAERSTEVTKMASLKRYYVLNWIGLGVDGESQISILRGYILSSSIVDVMCSPAWSTRPPVSPAGIAVVGLGVMVANKSVSAHPHTASRRRPSQ